MSKKCIFVQVIILVLLVHGLVSMVAKRSEAVREFDVVNEEYGTVQESHEDLGGRVELLGTQYGEEGALRQTFGVVKPEEKVYTIIVPEDHKKKLLPLAPKKSFWQKIWFGDDE